MQPLNLRPRGPSATLAEAPGRGQVTADEFYVDFIIEPTPAGWRSLELIAEATQDSEDCERLTLIVWADGGVRLTYVARTWPPPSSGPWGG